MCVGGGGVEGVSGGDLMQSSPVICKSNELTSEARSSQTTPVIRL